ncbi:uncharacterized protein LOC119069332 [Bradysia coprophila]|uniref:uncharacterized protein LOC119069332 n=1 Tax=Bradysia coprophila TaxID=38358 RepID=UPI00187DBE83|nr:uncharacterized protein LOC119069332 [Bradysia coprophila]
MERSIRLSVLLDGRKPSTFRIAVPSNFDGFMTEIKERIQLLTPENFRIDFKGSDRQIYRILTDEDYRYFWSQDIEEIVVETEPALTNIPAEPIPQRDMSRGVTRCGLFWRTIGFFIRQSHHKID